jgi:hypothetical protein
MGQLRDYFESGITSAQVRANPSMIAPIPFIENIIPESAGLTFAGSATRTTSSQPTALSR